MKKLLMLLLPMIMVLSFLGVANADIYIQPDPPDLWDLEHKRYYTWGLTTDEINVTDWSGIKNIELTFHDIYNWSSEDSQLFVWLLDDVAAGVNYYWDSGGGGGSSDIHDEFADDYTPDDASDGGLHLVTYETPDSSSLPDIPAGVYNRKDITYSFTQDEMDTFIAYLATGDNIGFGFDPDCHYYNTGITLAFLIPEPATMLLVGTGLIGLAGLGRKRLFKRGSAS